MSDNTENTVIETVESTPILVHGRSVEDLQGLKANFSLEKLGTPRFTVGLTTDAQLALREAAKNGTRIISTGLPLDISAKLGDVTIVRAWNKVREDGSRSSGATPPADFFAGQIIDAEAYATLKSSPLWAKAFANGEPEPVI